MAILAEKSGSDLSLNREEKRRLLEQTLARIETPLKRVLILPPDFTRFNSNAGELTAILYSLLTPECSVDILPALGTHVPMNEEEIRTMFGPDIPLSCFKVHDWRNGIVHLGDIPGEMIRSWSEGKVDFPVRVEVDKLLLDDYDLILSIGQVVPHEVIGMANYTKNILVGTGGSDIINKSHFLGAVHGMERMMGRIDTPVRKMLNYGAETYLDDRPIKYILTVMEKNFESGEMDMRGFFAGHGDALFAKAAALSQKVNLTLLDEPIRKVVVYLDPHEFKSTWLGNKSVYRTRMAIADAGELIVLAPGLREFGEDPEIDRLIRKYGYRGTPATLAAVDQNQELRDNLSAAAHLVHGSSEGRFTITYCPGPAVSREEIRSVGFNDGDLDSMIQRYDPETLRDGRNVMPDNEEIFFISNPALALWALREQFENA